MAFAQPREAAVIPATNTNPNSSDPVMVVYSLLIKGTV